MTALSTAMVQAAKLLSRYPQLPEPDASYCRVRQLPMVGYAVTLTFNPSEDTVTRHLTGLRKLATWAEAFGAYVTFDSRQARTVMDIEGERVNAYVNLFPHDRQRVEGLLGAKYHKLNMVPVEPATLLARIAAPEGVHA